jgi:hypothetical protein
MKLFVGLLVAALVLAKAETPALFDHAVGMYVHQHWPYKHPYAARTWTLGDWRGYADGLKKLGYNTIMIWPMMEFMPDPPTPTDRASLEKHAQVISMLHKQFGMHVMVTLCPNVVVNDAEAAKATYETRHFFYVDNRVNPADRNAVTMMIARREKLVSYLKDADAFAIIDSDPGGYPGSTNAEFVQLLSEHRKLFDRLRSGIELTYWMHAGWEAYSRFYQTGKLVLGDDAEHTDALRRLQVANPEPWGMANGLPFATKLGLDSRVISFNYGRIESEPSFPLTNYGGNAAYEGGHNPGPRGVMGNAQTHCVQLPNTFAFARGAAGQSLTEADYVQFAEDLIPGQGRVIVDSWSAVSAKDPAAMRKAATKLRDTAAGQVKTGRLGGLLFGDPQRFLTDLRFQLGVKAAYHDFLNASNGTGPVKPALASFISAAEAWQSRTGYQDSWNWPGMESALRKLNSPAVDAVLRVNICIIRCPEGAHPNGYDDVRKYLADQETFTPRLLAAMKEPLSSMR